ncbi:hypothetical protein L2E82_00004 [Cichorium intybus]|uniref:Uncharacterized protein n=1 Tax=Cichorium intybus TaxID=13427 RepID=A0ACB9GWW8_CICIN|nr:hypothetical protein L2E82_00004 [Cichorium intybus]
MREYEETDVEAINEKLNVVREKQRNAVAKGKGKRYYLVNRRGINRERKAAGDQESISRDRREEIRGARGGESENKRCKRYPLHHLHCKGQWEDPSTFLLLPSNSSAPVYHVYGTSSEHFSDKASPRTPSRIQAHLLRNLSMNALHPPSSQPATANFFPTDYRLSFQINRLPAPFPNQRLTRGFHHRPLLPPHATIPLSSKPPSSRPYDIALSLSD